MLTIWQYSFFLYWFHKVECLIFTGVKLLSLLLRDMKVWNFILLTSAKICFTQKLHLVWLVITQRRKSLFTCTYASHTSLWFSLQTCLFYHQKALWFRQNENERIKQLNQSLNTAHMLSFLFSFLYCFLTELRHTGVTDWFSMWSDEKTYDLKLDGRYFTVKWLESSLLYFYPTLSIVKSLIAPRSIITSSLF